MIHVTRHAIDRYQERVANVPEDAARRALSTVAIRTAADFGAEYVRLGTGHRVVINCGSVVTVLEPRHRNKSERRMRPKLGGNP